MKFFKLIILFLLAFTVSLYVFPIGFKFLPSQVNTKMILGVVGIFAYFLVSITRKSALFHNTTVTSLIISFIFSAWCFFVMIANGTPDDSYATYFMSFCVWLGAAYAVCSLLKKWHGRIDMAILVQYLAFACLVQCVSALLIDLNPRVEGFVNRYVEQGQDFVSDVNRLYGIGASLDSGGCRFAVVLILLAHMIATDKRVTDSRLQLTIALLSFFAITVLGNMIARVTTAGASLGLIYIFYRLGGSIYGILSRRKIRFYAVFLTLLGAAVAYVIYKYNSSPWFRDELRFGFEAFFNLFEQGVFRTGSTDKLNSTMWMWPTNFHDWMIGTGWFGNWVYGTDIGYCRFVLYCGLIGMVIFALFFVYNATVVVRKFRDTKFLAAMLLTLTFVIWIKVSTDIFWIYALLFCLPADPKEDEDGNPLQE